MLGIFWLGNSIDELMDNWPAKWQKKNLFVIYIKVPILMSIFGNSLPSKYS